MATANQIAIAVTYREAALEHIAGAFELYDSERYVLTNYIAGLAVECMLRSYRHMIDPEFDARHDVLKLFRLANFARIVPPRQVEEIGAALGDVTTLWSNDHRYLTEAALRKRWTKRKLYEGVKGNFLKARVRQLLNSAARIVSIGAVRWNHSFKS